MDTEPEWAAVLGVLYQEGAALDASAQSQSGQTTRSEATDATADEGEWDDELVTAQYDRIAADTGLSEREISDNVEWLDSHGLISKTEPPAETDATERYAVELEQAGFEIAQQQARHSREAEQGLARNKLQHSFNRAIALLALGLVTINMFDSAIQITLETGNLAVAYIVLALGFGGMIVVLAGLVYTGLLSSYPATDE